MANLFNSKPYNPAWGKPIFLIVYVTVMAIGGAIAFLVGLYQYLFVLEAPLTGMLMLVLFGRLFIRHSILLWELNDDHRLWAIVLQLALFLFFLIRLTVIWDETPDYILAYLHGLAMIINAYTIYWFVSNDHLFQVPWDSNKSL